MSDGSYGTPEGQGQSSGERTDPTPERLERAKGYAQLVNLSHKGAGRDKRNEALKV